MDSSPLVNTKERVIEINHDLIALEQVSEQFREKANAINRCLSFMHTSEKKLFALQQQLLSQGKLERETQIAVVPFAPDINLLNQELLENTKKHVGEMYVHFVAPIVEIREFEEQKNKEDQNLIAIPSIVDSILFLYAPYAIFPFVNSVREMISLIEEKERKFYLLSYMERWIYQFLHFLLKYTSGKNQETLLEVGFLEKPEYYPMIIEVIKFLHQKEQWAGFSAEIQRYSMVKMFLLFKKVLYLYLKKKQPISPTFHLLLSEFIHPSLAEDLHFEKDTMTYIMIGFYKETQRFQFLANLRKKRIKVFVDVYCELINLVEGQSKSSLMREKYVATLKTINRIIQKSHVLYDSSVPEDLRIILHKEFFKGKNLDQTLVTNSQPIQDREKNNQKELTAVQKLEQIKNRILATKPKEEKKPLPRKTQLVSHTANAKEKKKSNVASYPPPSSREITVYLDEPMRRKYDEFREILFPLIPSDVTNINQWSHEKVSIFQSPDVLWYVLQNGKARGAYTLPEIIELCRIPFRFEYFDEHQRRSVKFVNFAQLIAMDLKEKEIETMLNLLQNSGQLNEDELTLILEMIPIFREDANLGSFIKIFENPQPCFLNGEINPQEFVHQHQRVSKKMISAYPYLQQIMTYWEFLDHVLLLVAKKIDPTHCKKGYQKIDVARFKRYLSTQQVDLYHRILKELQGAYANTFLGVFLLPRLADLLEFKISPDLLDLCTAKVVPLSSSR